MRFRLDTNLSLVPVSWRRLRESTPNPGGSSCQNVLVFAVKDRRSLLHAGPDTTSKHAHVNRLLEPCGIGYHFVLNFSRLYFSDSRILSSAGRDAMYLLHPGHHPACHLHRRPRSDLGFLSYLALSPQFPHLGAAIRNPPFFHGGHPGQAWRPHPFILASRFCRNLSLPKGLPCPG